MSAAVFAAPSYPTPVSRMPRLGGTRAELWLKNDGLSHPVYGGNKVRKAELLVNEALRRGARRVFSFGAAGSHHLLTLTLFARAVGLESAAVVLPQPHSAHALDTLRAALGAGLRVQPARHAALIPFALARSLRRGDYLIAPGGSNLIGARACESAVDELAQQVEAGLLPVPDVIVVPLGSGGTCAGIAAGVVRRAWPTRVLGVQVVSGPGPRVAAHWLARAVLRAAPSPAHGRQLATCLRFDASHVGAGYGSVSESGAQAMKVAREVGLELDQTYTAKAFAHVLRILAEPPPELAVSGRPLRVLYWHTLAATPLEPLLARAPHEKELPDSIRQLLR